MELFAPDLGPHYVAPEGPADRGIPAGGPERRFRSGSRYRGQNTRQQLGPVLGKWRAGDDGANNRPGVTLAE